MTSKNQLFQLASLLIARADEKKREEAEQEKAAFKFFLVLVALIFGPVMLGVVLGTVLYFVQGDTTTRVSIVAAILFLFGWFALLRRVGSPRRPPPDTTASLALHPKFALTPEQHRNRAAIIRQANDPATLHLADVHDKIADYQEQGPVRLRQ